MDPLVGKMEEMVEQSKKSLEVNQAALTSLGIIDKRLKRLNASPEAAQQQAYQRRY